MFGVSSSASQIEGATAEEGKGPTLMDILVQDDQPKDYVTNENYYLYKQDIERVAAMGTRYYSFSIAWSRILPFALPGTPVNQAGLDHYRDVIDTVLAAGMIPAVTLLHFLRSVMARCKLRLLLQFHRYATSGSSHHSRCSSNSDLGER